jgi:hypothetical protein
MSIYGTRNNKEYLGYVIAVMHLIKQKGTAAEVKETFAALVEARKEISPFLISLTTRPNARNKNKKTSSTS